MELQVNIPLLGAGAKELLSDPVLAKDLGPNPNWACFDQKDPALERVLRGSASGSGLTLVPVIKFSKQEMEMSPWCEPLMKSLLKATDADFDDLLSLIRNTKLQDKGGRLGKGVRVLKLVRLSALKVGEREVACVSEGIPEYVLGPGVVSLFKAAGLNGWSTRHVINKKTGEPLSGGTLLWTDVFSGPVGQDHTLWKCTGTKGEDHFRFVGCMVIPAASLSHLPDFARTSEPLGINDFPAWIVSQRVRKLLDEKGVRGWKWRPVIESGSELHKRYMIVWEPLLNLVRLNPKNTF